MSKRVGTYKTDADKVMELMGVLAAKIYNLETTTAMLIQQTNNLADNVESLQIMLTAACELLIEKNTFEEKDLQDRTTKLASKLAKRKQKYFKKFMEQTKKRMQSNLMDSENMGHA